MNQWISAHKTESVRTKWNSCESSVNHAHKMNQCHQCAQLHDLCESVPSVLMALTSSAALTTAGRCASENVCTRHETSDRSVRKTWCRASVFSLPKYPKVQKNRILEIRIDMGNWENKNKKAYTFILTTRVFCLWHVDIVEKNPTSRSLRMVVTKRRGRFWWVTMPSQVY